MTSIDDFLSEIDVNQDDVITYNHLKNILTIYTVKLLNPKRSKCINTILRILQIPTLDVLKPKRGNEKQVVGRQIVMWYLCTYKNYSTTESGSVFNRDHTTAMHAMKIVNEIIECKDKKFFPVVQQFLKQMGEKELK